MSDVRLPLGDAMKIGGLLFALGVAYAGMLFNSTEIKRVEQRLDKKIQLINENHDDIHELELENARAHP